MISDITRDDLLFGAAAVGNSHHAEIYQEPELLQALLNYNSACEIEPSMVELIPTEEYCRIYLKNIFVLMMMRSVKKISDEGYRAGAVAQIFGGFSEVDIPIGCYTGQASEVSIVSVQSTQYVTFSLSRKWIKSQPLHRN